MTAAPHAQARRAAAPTITTRRGDRGTTHLPGHGKLPKHHPLVEALGALDELVCALGLARATPEAPAELRNELLRLQRELFRLGAQLAGARRARTAAAALLRRWTRRAQELEQTVAWPAGFVLPGATSIGAHLDSARAAARRLERRVSALAADAPPPVAMSAALNRLSDYLWLLARAVEPLPDLLDERARRHTPPTSPSR
ncbi:MAG: cob(I)yrinic acid a,c-diamide adenosyltransferase [Kiritimatiellae bacterium]|nr:cob(I)yrinic acid a,c-diamide adenosyltransferase [Kiritimatiellia bacterium]